MKYEKPKLDDNIMKSIPVIEYQLYNILEYNNE